MKNHSHQILLGLIAITLIWSCTTKSNGNSAPGSFQSNLTIFFINDQHGSIDNFSKIKHIVDREELKTNVIVASTGDMFSGNPVVDFHADKGYPMIDLMNDVGVDIHVLGNHEFDYGNELLTTRMEQSDFSWVCANVDMKGTGVPEPLGFKTIDVDDLKITFLGLLETYGNMDSTIPSTHPMKVQHIGFKRPENVVHDFASLKSQEDADLYIALTHLGRFSDFELAHTNPYFDLIIGGHSHNLVDTIVNNIPIYQAGDNLEYLGKIELLVADKRVQSVEFELIELVNYTAFDDEIKSKIENFNYMPELDVVIGFSEIHHDRYYNVGCFFTDVIREQMNVDVSFQNSGGVRGDLDEGDITRREIFAITPFNNAMVKYTMTVSELTEFLKQSEESLYYSGIVIEQLNNEVILRSSEGHLLDNNLTLTVGMNDYISAVFIHLLLADVQFSQLTDTETIFAWFENNTQPINYPECDRYFKYRPTQINNN